MNKFQEYFDPSKLVSTDWVAENLANNSFRLVESNEDRLLYRSGHIPGAIEIDWVEDLNDALLRDYLDQEKFSKLLSKHGIDQNTEVVFYGDKNNWWACYALWVFQLFGHNNVKIMDGGRKKWELEKRELTREIPVFASSNYQASVRDDKSNRAFRDYVLNHQQNGKALVDVRSPAEYSGEKLHMEGYPNEGALRGGHIPGAKSIPWAQAINDQDGSFKSRAELEKIYIANTGFQIQDEVIAYCRIGERSSHTWFVLKYLLGFKNVKNYDGSWTEWGNLVGVPIER